MSKFKVGDRVTPARGSVFALAVDEGTVTAVREGYAQDFPYVVRWDQGGLMPHYENELEAV